MSSDIDAIKDYNPPASGGKFLKLNDGESVKVRITSLPVIFQNKFELNGEVTISTRFAFIVWNHDSEVAQIWQTNGATYSQQIKPLLDPVDEDQESDWRKFDVKISRTGEKAQTRYNIKAGTKVYDLTRDQLDAVGAIDIVTDIDKSENASQVMWLAEWRELEEKEKKSALSGYAKAKSEELKPTKEKEDVVIEDISDEPINLDDIPF